jgi:6-phosphogluconate dehydrogenase (decarboxylating)
MNDPSCSAVVVRKINAAFGEKNLYMLDSPASGGPSGATSGKMAIWAGGEEQIFNCHKPVLDALGRPSRLYRPDRRRDDRQARAQLHQCGDGRGARRGLYDGDQGRGRAARVMGGGAPGGYRPAAHL